MPSSLRRALLASLHGGRGPHHAAMAVAFGIVAGFVTGWNLSLALVLLLAALFNVRTKIFAIAWGAGLAVASLVSGATYRAGQLLLDGTPLGATIGAFGDSVWVAMFDWDCYTLAGGGAIGLALAVAAAKLVVAFSPPWEDAQAPGQGLLRPYWYLPVGCGLLVFALAPWQLGPLLAKRELLRQLAAVNGAPVEARDVRLSLWTGELEIEGLQFVDPARLDRDCVRIGLATTRVNPGALLRGRLAADKLTLSNLRVDVARRRAVPSPLSRTVAKPSYTQPAQASFTARKEEVEVDGYLRDWPLVRERLAWLGRLVAGLDALAAYDAAGGSWPGQTRRSRSELARPQPRVRIESVRAEELPHLWGLGRTSVLEIAGLTSHPSPEERPTRVEIMAPEFTAEIFAEFKLQKRQERHKVRFAAYDCQLTDWVEPASAHQAVVISGGKLDLQGEGWMTGKRLEMHLQLESKPLDVRVASHDRLAGVAGTIWDRGLRRLGGLRLEAKLAGPWTAPVLSVNAERLVAQFKHQLRAASEHELVAAIAEQLAHPDAPMSPGDEQVAVDGVPPGADQVEAEPASAAGEGGSEFCTVTDEPAPQTVANPFDGWRRARSAETEVAQPTAPYEYPRTAAPDSDPADRFIATLDKPNAEPTPPEQSSQEELVAENQAAYPKQKGLETPQIKQTRYARPEMTATPPMRQTPLSWQDRSLPGPINLVVGRQDHPSANEVELANWPDETALREEEAAANQPPLISTLARWADGVRDRLRRAMPTRRPEVDPTLPPDLDSEPAPGEEELIDEALNPPSTASKKPWFPLFWR